MNILATLLVLLVASLQFVAAAGARPSHALPVLTYIAAGSLLTAAASARFVAHAGAVGWAVAGGVAACAAPLLWGRAIGEFHASHHIVRLVIVCAVVGLFAWTAWTTR